ncbi:F-box domain-containing protein [Mycena indigotica]|uniref:F-box domain-containing protein n=1 Tax=Mycena indigotica TaxID=2126181 RepID=A0A8H6WHP6_9AGAR|nr:F-box domain-containing protein [Mycena indigotica]KAF7312669.1 F-box domain-containing protein [Mycena indigotica]
MSSLFEMTVLCSGKSFIAAVFRPVHDLHAGLSLPKLKVPHILGLPDELLSEIFSHLVDPWFSTFNRRNPVWALTKVCVRWREIAVHDPRFWRDINCRDWIADDIEKTSTHSNYSRAVNRTELQVSRSAQAPLTLELIPGPAPTLTYDIFARLLASSDRLESAILILDNNLMQRFLEHKAGFPALKRLRIASTDEQDEAIPKLLQGLTALEDLRFVDQLRPQWLPSLVPVWNRLNNCELKHCVVDDVLLVMPHFLPGTRLAIVSGLFARDLESLKPVEECHIFSLSFDQCNDMYITEVLNNTTAPSLKRLAIWQYQREPFDTLSAMLTRSSAALTHLALGLPSISNVPDFDVTSTISLLAFLNSSHGESLVDLDLQLFDSYHSANNHLVKSLALIPSTWQLAPHLPLPSLPNLRALALRGYMDDGYDGERRLLMFAAHHYPVLQSLWIEGALPVFSKKSIEALHDHGVEFVRSYDMGWW